MAPKPKKPAGSGKGSRPGAATSSTASRRTLRPSAAVRRSPAAASSSGRRQPLAGKAPATATTHHKVDRPPTPLGRPELLNKGGSDKRNVLVIYTGGTMGMQDLGDGSLGPVPRALYDRLRKMEELAQTRMPRCFFMEFQPLMDSADMTPTDWTAIAEVISDEYLEYDGFVVIHGTDTLAYTASALSFMLEQLAKPVVITGSMTPFFEPLSDARQNFLGAVAFAGLADISEVCVFFAGKLFRGNRTNKSNATSLQAFVSPSYPPLAELGAEINIFRRRLREPPRGRFRLHPIRVTDIMVLWVIPGFSDDFFEPLFRSKCVKGIVLLLYGCGTAPARKETFLRHVRRLVKSGVVIVACSQCLKGTVALDKYGVGKAFQDCGVISAVDMTTEATVTKLAYLLSKGLPPDQCRKAMEEDLRGEMSTEVTTFSINEPVTGISAL